MSVVCTYVGKYLLVQYKLESYYEAKLKHVFWFRDLKASFDSNNIHSNVSSVCSTNWGNLLKHSFFYIGHNHFPKKEIPGGSFRQCN